MLIVAIPKSASTSLMLTIGKYQNIKAIQDFSVRDNPPPKTCNKLHQLHSDIRELTESNVEQLSKPQKINKQHIFPSPNNLQLLSNVKKVVLLRSPKEIVLAYRRGAIKNVHNLLPGYDIKMSEKEWLKKSKSDGLYDDLSFFFNEWKTKANAENTLFVNYTDYLKTPNKVINLIETFYHLPLTNQKITTIKARYSRHNNFTKLFDKIKNKTKSKLYSAIAKLKKY